MYLLAKMAGLHFWFNISLCGRRTQFTLQMIPFGAIDICCGGNITDNVHRGSAHIQYAVNA